MSVFHSGGEVVEGVGGSPERSGARIFPLNDECAAEVRQKRDFLLEFCCTLCE